MAKKVKNYPKVNFNMKYSVLAEYKETLKKAMSKIDVQLPLDNVRGEKNINIEQLAK